MFPAVVGCGAPAGDDPPGKTTPADAAAADVGSPGPVTPTPVTPTPSVDGGPGPTPPQPDATVPTPTDGCDAVQRDYLTANEVALNDASRTCGIECITSADDGACFTQCMNRELAGSPIAGSTCLDCIGDRVGCVRDNCILQCLDSSSPACTSCQCMAGCQSIFDQCAGTMSVARDCGGLGLNLA
jgi:hypothetical protein